LRNPGIAEVLFLAGYIERWGSGVKKMNGLMKEYGLSKPVYEEISGNFLVTFKRKYVSGKERTIGQATEQVPSKYRPSPEQVKILRFCKKPKKRSQIQKHLKLKHREYFRTGILGPLLEKGFIKMTLPDKPKSSKQEYVITDKGKKMIENSRKDK
jgi:predicted HTH transcriptional regulator